MSYRATIVAGAFACLVSIQPAIGGATIHQARAHIQHVIIIMQENRSFDNYFGTFPGADGIPAGVCMPINPVQTKLGCAAPFHDVHDINAGGPHYAVDAMADLDDGVTKALMDGFIASQIAGDHPRASKLTQAQSYLAVQHHDVIGYHTDAEIPNYWSYARNFVLQDHMFEGVRSWSWASHLEMVSEWTASCTDPQNALSCTSNLTPEIPSSSTTFPWVNLFQLLDTGGVSWKYYITSGPAPDCPAGQVNCEEEPQAASRPTIWNPVGKFNYVVAQGSAYLQSHNQDTSQFFIDLQNNTLPSVSWVVPNGPQSEHPPNGVTTGMTYVTGLINAVARSPYWNNTAIFLAWDDWGGFYDHVLPPNVDMNATVTPIQGYGLRVPGLLISAYAQHGLIDHSILSFDNYARFVEDLFLKGARLDPVAMGNPDNRPDIRDEITTVPLADGTTAPVGNLLNEFDFDSPAQPPPILPTTIPGGLLALCDVRPKVSTLCRTRIVTLSWNAVLSTQGVQPYTYHIVRDTPPVTVCTTTSLSCTDKPGSGTHLYRAFTVDAHGLTSPMSAATEADEP